MSWHSLDFDDKEVAMIPLADPAKLKTALRPPSNHDGISIARRSIGFTFSGGGFLLPYHLACIRALKEISLIGNEGHCQQVGGASAGSLAAAVVACSLDLNVVDRAVDEMTDECRKNGTWGKLGGCLREKLEELLPEDAHLRCNGRLHVAVTKVKPWGALRSKRVTHYESRDDLIAALLASCHLPILSTGSLTTSFRGRRVVDGGFTDVMPVMRDTCANHVVKISCLMVDMLKKMPMMHRSTGLRHLAISPCMFGDWPFTADETFKAAIGPGSDNMISNLRRAGDRDVKRWWAELTQEFLSLSDGLSPFPREEESHFESSTTRPKSEFERLDED